MVTILVERIGNVMKIISTNLPTAGPAVSTDRWYDRHTRCWVVQAKDCEDNQVGEAIYVYSKREAVAEQRQMVLDIERGLYQGE